MKIIKEKDILKDISKAEKKALRKG